jgi:signal transduction histidine kinase
VRRGGGRLVVEVADDGRGGARERDGTGLAGLRDRARAVDGTFSLTSPPGAGTTLRMELPCAS